MNLQEWKSKVEAKFKSLGMSKEDIEGLLVIVSMTWSKAYAAGHDAGHDAGTERMRSLADSD